MMKTSSKLANSGTQQFVNVNGSTAGQGYFSIFSGPSGTAYKMKIQSEIYKVAVYTKALTSSEVSQNYGCISEVPFWSLNNRMRY